MKTGIVNIIAVLTVALAFSGCSTTATPGLASKSSQPILSAAQAKAMIHVEVRTLEPTPAEVAVLASLAQ